MALNVLDGSPAVDGVTPGSQPTPTTQPVTLDFSQAQPVSPATPDTQNAGANVASGTTGSPVTLDFSQAQPLQQTTQPQSQPTQSQTLPGQRTGEIPVYHGGRLVGFTMAGKQGMRPADTVSATPGSMPNDPFAAKAQNWANNVSSDLKNGTSITGVGRFLKSLGSHGFDYGVSPGVADFMGSIPLGLIRAIKGAAELPQSGQRWQGTKDVAGGALQAATIPASFVTPEAGEIAGQGINTAGDVIASQASRAAQAVKAPFSLDSIQPELQGGIRDAVNAAAQDLGVQPSSAASIRDVASDVAQAAKAKASGLYRQLDAAVGNTRFQTYQEQLDDALQDLRNSVSEVDPDAHGELIEKVNNLEAAKQKAYQAVKDAGLDPNDLYAKAQNLWRRGSALEDLGSHVEKSTSGMRPELAADAAKSNPETVSTSKSFFLNRTNQMYNDARLQVALGEDKAKQLLQTVDAAHLRALKIAANQRYAKLAGRIALYGGGYEALRHGASHLLGE